MRQLVSKFFLLSFISVSIIVSLILMSMLLPAANSCTNSDAQRSVAREMAEAIAETPDGVKYTYGTIPELLCKFSLTITHKKQSKLIISAKCDGPAESHRILLLVLEVLKRNW